MGGRLSDVPDSAKSEALEVLDDYWRLGRKGKGPLTAEIKTALWAAGMSPLERPKSIPRDWGEADDTVVRRLAQVRGWSPRAIAVFLHRDEVLIRRKLAQTA